MIYLCVPSGSEDKIACSVDDGLALASTDLKMITEFAQTNAKADKHDFKVYKLVETHYYKGRP